MPDLVRESELRTAGFLHIAGVDEVGRGPLAGPVVAAAVILAPDEKRLTGLNDSKKLSARQREAQFKLIQDHALDYSLGVVSHQVIDRINILQATYLAMWRALKGLRTVDAALIDGNRRVPFFDKSQTPVVKGDQHSLSIAAASVLAKVFRDRLMDAFAQHFPGYGFERHSGYPTKAHREAVLSKGLCPIHRRSFCKKILAAQT